MPTSGLVLTQHSLRHPKDRARISCHCSVNHVAKGEQCFLGREKAHPMMNAPLNMLMRWNPWGPHFGKDGRRPPHPSMAWRFCEAPDLNTLCVCRHCLFFVISCFFSSHSVGKDENLQLLIVSWHEPSTFLACYFFSFFWLHRTFL